MRFQSYLKSIHWLILAVAVLGGSCVHELPVPADTSTGGGGGGGTPPPANTCDPNTVYFQPAILAIFTSTCGQTKVSYNNGSSTTSCHGKASDRDQHFYDYASITKSIGQASSIDNLINKMLEKTRPGEDVAGLQLNQWRPSDDDIKLINKWIAQGMKDNSCTPSCDWKLFNSYSDVKPIFDSYCGAQSGCHINATTTNKNVGLKDYTSIKAVETSTPGRLVASIEWTDSNVAHMPLTATQKMDTCYINRIKRWIAKNMPQ
jgi:hypothetical protein